MERRNAWKELNKEELAAAEELCFFYRRFLDEGKTERECAKQVVSMAEKAGYRPLKQIIRSGKGLKPGDKVYAEHMSKSVALFYIGEEPPENGMNIIGAHIDSPRLDIKQMPLYEQDDMVYMDTHYYGGIKKYQWLALPLALRGIVVKKDETQIRIQEEEDGPVFVISDLLPHLGKEINDKKVKDFVDAEKMDLLVGNRPLPGGNVKDAILRLLLEQYQINEEDFLSAELEVVPAGKAKDCGLDRSMIIGYGHDDRSCAFAALEALLGIKEKPFRTAVCLLVDKEETGSRGATGMHSRFFENAAAEVVFNWKKGYETREPDRISFGYPERLLSGQNRKREYGRHEPLDILIRRSLLNSRMLSADVSAAYDPMFDKYFEKKNAAYLGGGIVFNKYSGRGGKTGGNDANPEFIAQLRRLMDDSSVVFQTAELGAVDKGGGGTIAYIMAEYGMQVIDCGIAVLNMHAPWEVVSKADLYEAVKGYRAFYLYDFRKCEKFVQ